MNSILCSMILVVCNHLQKKNKVIYILILAEQPGIETTMEI
jgi:hypothetical protein